MLENEFQKRMDKSIELEEVKLLMEKDYRTFKPHISVLKQNFKINQFKLKKMKDLKKIQFLEQLFLKRQTKKLELKNEVRKEVKEKILDQDLKKKQFLYNRQITKQYKILELMNRSDIEIPFMTLGSRVANIKQSSNLSEIKIPKNDEKGDKLFCFNLNSPSFSGADYNIQQFNSNIINTSIYKKNLKENPTLNLNRQINDHSINNFKEEYNQELNFKLLNDISQNTNNETINEIVNLKQSNVQIQSLKEQNNQSIEIKIQNSKRNNRNISENAGELNIIKLTSNFRNPNNNINDNIVKQCENDNILEENISKQISNANKLHRLSRCATSLKNQHKYKFENIAFFTSGNDVFEKYKYLYTYVKKLKSQNYKKVQQNLKRLNEENESSRSGENDKQFFENGIKDEYNVEEDDTQKDEILSRNSNIKEDITSCKDDVLNDYCIDSPKIIQNKEIIKEKPKLFKNSANYLVKKNNNAIKFAIPNIHKKIHRFEENNGKKADKKQKEIRKYAYWKEIILPNYVPKSNSKKELEREINTYKSYQDGRMNKFKFIHVFKF